VTPPAAPGLGRRLACVFYEGLLVAALMLVAAFPFVPLTQGLAPAIAKASLQVYLILVAGAYFTLFWRKGQTLAMKTWGIRIESARGGAPSFGQAWSRYLLSCLNLVLLGVGWWSALFSRDRQFLQDRLAGTRLIRI
jgi:uncharacterized RDD family membrane protein YckC